MSNDGIILKFLDINFYRNFKICSDLHRDLSTLISLDKSAPSTFLENKIESINSLPAGSIKTTSKKVIRKSDC